MTVQEALAMAAAALSGDRTAVFALSDAMAEHGMDDAAVRTKELAARERASCAGGLALALLAHPPGRHVLIGNPMGEDAPSFPVAVGQAAARRCGEAYGMPWHWSNDPAAIPVVQVTATR